MDERPLLAEPPEILPVDYESSSATASNAMKHGLTASRQVPLELGQQTEELRGQFREEYQPTGITESLLVDEMARHAAALQIAERAEGAVLRHGARQLGSLVGIDAENYCDAALTAAVSSQSVERLTRYRRAHERAFLAALSKLQQLRLQRPTPSPKSLTEEACRTVLLRRFRQPGWRCPRCANCQGSWLATRHRWQCSRCRAQIGLREGTIMEGSSLALVTWFAAIRLVLEDEFIGVADLAAHINIQRHKTVRRLLRTIRQALDAARRSSAPAELSAPIRCFLQNGIVAEQLLQLLAKPGSASLSGASSHSP